ncbi:dihydrofolate reductase family protein [Luteimonas salinilitoris]|uniref:Dihydrofolate reductase family protein n=1 Tax=Luteimonas salinilitoris TaxID=3237697 RepID=A0ABV4HU84_9GAMM
MRRLIVWNLMTLDGYFEGRAPWDLGFHETVWGDELAAFSLEQGQEIGTLLFGRRTYEGMAGHWTKATGAVADMMNSVEKAVTTRTLEAADWNNTRLLKGDAADAVRGLKAETGKDIYVFGSADLLASLLKAGLVDEYRVCVAPVVLGAGTPLFKSQDNEVHMHLASARPLKTGGVILTYTVGG